MSEKNKPVRELVHCCSTGEIADLFGMTERSVQTLARNGIIPRLRQGRFDLIDTVKAYVKYLREKAAGQVEAMKESPKTRLLRAQADECEAKAVLRHMEVEVERGKLLKRSDIERQLYARFIEIKAALLEMPRRVAFRFTDPEISLYVEEEVNTLVGEILAQYSREGILPDRPVAPRNHETGDEAAEGYYGQ